MKYITLFCLAYLVHVIASAKEPGWVRNMPKSDLYKYSVGESNNETTKDGALNEAWVNSLVKLGLSEFPELSKLSLKFKESLYGTESENLYESGLEYVNWRGIEEVKDLGSPYIIYNEATETYKVYRLLKWSKKSIVTNKLQHQKNMKYQMPPSPEKFDSAVIEETSALVKLNSLNKEIEKSNAYYGSVLMKVKCGITIHQLKSILGNPHTSSDTTPRSYGFYITVTWGTYRVEYSSSSPVIQEITPNHGSGRTYYPCRK